jgi:hypothetical protein
MVRVMAFVSLTRLRIRSVRFLPRFAIHAVRSTAQVRRAPGFLGGSLLADRRRTFWTVTAWDGEASMRGYMTAGAHRRAMPFLLDWCDEASVAHWEQDGDALPTWTDADRRMRETGRPSKLRFPTALHPTLDYDPPRTGRGVPIVPSQVPSS